jgi:ComF family protein
MLDGLISLIAPHPCSSCGEIGDNLCDYCKYNIENEQFGSCIKCGVLAGQNGICKTCIVPYDRAWCVGERSGVLEKLINRYKFDNNYAAYRTIAELLSNCIGILPQNATLVPVPTVASHIRQRGYDHTLLVARHVAKLQGVALEQPLYRVGNDMQRGNGKHLRSEQAARAFGIKNHVKHSGPYLLIDDVITTGATLQYAARALRQAGAREVWVAVIARQPLD